MANVNVSRTTLEDTARRRSTVRVLGGLETDHAPRAYQDTMESTARRFIAFTASQAVWKPNVSVRTRTQERSVTN
ncbi:hypothetical protein OESDEN_02132 [Oesophagostomum dentatum]|uniref:Uncharacterized protein n=1 Tax=Oesophagostomum dentatum TaxID=61180 RepID=A0A0B1TP42_OESDE|nr:hypothetical protein OESDEN_02132 [Oesophagostomum dentatum]